MAQQDFSATFCLLVLFWSFLTSFPVAFALEVSEDFEHEVAPKVALLLGVITIVCFGLYVVYYSKHLSNLPNDQASSTSPKITTLKSSSVEDFLTARKSIGWTTIALSLYASAVGSGAITAPAEFGFYGGALGVFAYAFATALPLFIISGFGPIIHNLYPKLLSLSDFILFRFGKCSQLLVVFIMILNMSAATIAEYTTLSSLYSDFVGLKDYTFLFIVLVAVVTLSYTAYGGLRASIITDRVQAISSLFLLQVLVIYLTADFDTTEIRKNSNKNQSEYNDLFNFDKDLKGLNKSGFSSLFTLPLSLITATVFSEAMWQRSWASVDKVSLRKASVLGFVLVFSLVGTFGTVGLLVNWANLVTFEQLENENFNPNLFAFQVFNNEHNKQIVSSAIGVLVLLLATILATGAVDSLQNGIEASFLPVLIKSFPNYHFGLFSARILLVLINVPLVVIGLQKYSILSVFLLDNMICVCAFLPIVLSFIDNKVLNELHRDWMPFVNLLTSLFCVIVYEAVEKESLSKGLKFAFWENTLYEYEPFLVGLLTSFGATTIIYSVVYWFNREYLEEKFNSQLESISVEEEEKEEML